MGMTALMAIGIGTAIIGGMTKAAGAMMEGQAQADAYNRMAQQLDWQAGAIGDQAHRDVLWHRDNVERFTGAQRAGLAANGMAGTQTALELLSDTERQAKLDELTIQHNADLRIHEAQTQARLARAGARDAMNAANWNAFNSMIGMASQVGSQWYRWSQTGMGMGPTTGNLPANPGYGVPSYPV